MPQENPDQEFLAILHRLQPVTIQELCQATGVTATAVRQRLFRLQGEGWVAREVARQERGRPHHTYSATSAGLKQLGNDQGEMAAVLWREIMRIEPAEIRHRVLAGVKDALVERFGVQAASVPLANRLQGMCSSLAEFGFDINVVDEAEQAGAEPLSQSPGQRSGTLPILREHNCPYYEIADRDPSVCELEQSVFSEILGTPVELSSCRLEGHRCCEFQVG